MMKKFDDINEFKLFLKEHGFNKALKKKIDWNKVSIAYDYKRQKFINILYKFSPSVSINLIHTDSNIFNFSELPKIIKYNILKKYDDEFYKIKYKYYKKIAYGKSELEYMLYRYNSWADVINRIEYYFPEVENTETIQIKNQEIYDTICNKDNKKVRDFLAMELVKGITNSDLFFAKVRKSDDYKPYAYNVVNGETVFYTEQAYLLIKYFEYFFKIFTLCFDKLDFHFWVNQNKFYYFPDELLFTYYINRYSDNRNTCITFYDYLDYCKSYDKVYKVVNEEPKNEYSLKKYIDVIDLYEINTNRDYVDVSDIYPFSTLIEDVSRYFDK